MCTPSPPDADASPGELARRMRAKPDQTRSDHDLVTNPGLLQRLQDRYDQIAAIDPTAPASAARSAGITWTASPPTSSATYAPACSPAPTRTHSLAGDHLITAPDLTATSTGSERCTGKRRC
jgi:hypothetical protein